MRVVLDTEALIQQGQLASDCSNLRIFGGVDCAESRSYDTQRTVPASLGAAWADTTEPASFQIAEFRYENRGGSTVMQLMTSRGTDFSYTAPPGCTLPDALPVLISLDHAGDQGSPTQRVDYIYVRPAAATEPATSVLSDSTQACGSAS